VRAKLRLPAKRNGTSQAAVTTMKASRPSAEPRRRRPRTPASVSSQMMTTGSGSTIGSCDVASVTRPPGIEKILIAHG
jgi:hypothetical protein